jgi:2,3-bisphosphoglycerate-dependent phosphoglycerate mutase
MQTFYIVRHAEKNGNTDEAGLTAAGIERAVELERYLADKKLDTVFTSNIRRTILTGLSVALPQSLPQIPLKQAPQNELDNFIARIKNIRSTKNILVVGHTNTMPAIVQALSGESIPAIPEHEYNNMYIITIKGKEKTLVHTTYGR